MRGGILGRVAGLGLTTFKTFKTGIAAGILKVLRVQELPASHYASPLGLTV
jgi:hypothetical protein